jgi:hypothetical protein
MASPQCPLPKQVPVCQLVCTHSSTHTVTYFSFPFAGAHVSPTADIIADLSVILLPIRLFRCIQDKRLRWRLIFIFSTSSISAVPPLFTRTLTP